jgi:hypothetical protein
MAQSGPPYLIAAGVASAIATLVQNPAKERIVDRLLIAFEYTLKI